MNPWPMRVVCDICGGPGVGSVRTAGAMYDPRVRVTHSDPRVCRDYLETARRKAEREAELAAEEAEKYPPINWRPTHV